MFMHPALRIAAILCLAAAGSAAAHPANGLVVAGDGTIYFADGPAHTVWRLAPGEDEAVPLIIGSMEQDPSVPHHLVLAPDGGLYTASDRGGVLLHITPEGDAAPVSPEGGWTKDPVLGRGGEPFTRAADGTVWAWDSGAEFTQSRLWRIPTEGEAEMVIGPERGHADGRTGEDGEASEARLGDLHGSSMILTPQGDLLLTDDARWVRRVSKDGVVTTIAGGAERGFADGAGGEARFDWCAGLALAPDGSVIVADAGNHRIRRIGEDGEVTTIAGSGRRGNADGPAMDATFAQPAGVAVDEAGVIYILDHAAGHDDRPVIRRLSEEGAVSTVGAPVQAGRGRD